MPSKGGGEATALSPALETKAGASSGVSGGTGTAHPQRRPRAFPAQGSCFPSQHPRQQEGEQVPGCPHGGSPCPATPEHSFPSPGIHPHWAPARRARRDSRDLLRNPGQEAPLDACPSGLEQTLERSSLLGFKVFPILKNSWQPPLNPSAGKASLFLFRLRFQPGCPPLTPAVPMCRALPWGCGRWVPGPPRAPSPAPASPPSPSALWIQFLPQQPTSKRGPRGSPPATTNRSRKHLSRQPGLARSLCTPARGSDLQPSRLPFLWGSAKKPPQFLASGRCCRQALWQRGRLGFGASRRCLASPGVGRRDVWRREQGQHIVFSNKGIKHLKP